MMTRVGILQMSSLLLQWFPRSPRRTLYAAWVNHPEQVMFHLAQDLPGDEKAFVLRKVYLHPCYIIQSRGLTYYQVPTP